MKAVVLAAGRGRRFGAMTTALPKCLLPLDRRGSNLLRRYLESFRATGIVEVVIVVGHLGRSIRRECAAHGRGLKIRFIENAEYRRGSLVSLYRASGALRGGALIMDADVYFETGELKKLLASGRRSAFLADKRSKSTGEEMMLMSRRGRPWHIAKRLVPGLVPVGEATGLFKLGSQDAGVLKRILGRFYKEGVKDVEYEDAYCELLKKRKARIVPVSGFWSEMDFVSDRKKISAHMAAKGKLRPSG